MQILRALGLLEYSSLLCPQLAAKLKNVVKCKGNIQVQVFWKNIKQSGEADIVWRLHIKHLNSVKAYSD